MSCHRTIIRLSAVLASLALGWACGGDSATAPEPARPTTVTVSPATHELTALGQTVQLTAEAFDENGHAVAGAEFSWESSDAAVAAVDAGGLVTGVAEGTATITASAGSGQGTAEITVGLNPDRATLVALYEATDGPNWVNNNNNWLTDAPLDEWYGVDTDDSGRVVGLSLDRNNLEGSMPTELGSLASLTSLELWENELTGSIPPELGNLANLTSLRLRSNELTGPIPPELGNLISLTRLELWDNELTGSIPPELGNLASLTSLELWQNNLTGPIPPELGNLTSLTNLELSGNNLTGPIPPELGNLVNLTYLGLGGNNLTSPIPPELGNLVNLTYLGLRRNNLTSPIPAELGSLTGLTSLGLSFNNLTGPIPPELGRLASLTQLLLSNNNLSGLIPESFLQIHGLTRFRFDRNADLCAPGTSDFVTWVQNIQHVAAGPYCNESDTEALEHLYQTSGGPDWSNFSGWLETPALEEWYGVTANSLGRVVTLDLARNGLEGRLPAGVGSLTEMTTLRLSGNALSDQLPLSLTRLSLVEFHYADTGLCAPAEASFRAWLNGIASHEGTGVECAPPL